MFQTKGFELLCDRDGIFLWEGGKKTNGEELKESYSCNHKLHIHSFTVRNDLSFCFWQDQEGNFFFWTKCMLQIHNRLTVISHFNGMICWIWDQTVFAGKFPEILRRNRNSQFHCADKRLTSRSTHTKPPTATNIQRAEWQSVNIRPPVAFIAKSHTVMLLCFNVWVFVGNFDRRNSSRLCTCWRLYKRSHVSNLQ